MRERLLSASPWRVALAVLAFHAAWIGAYLAAGHEIRDFIKLGPVWVASSDRSDAIQLDVDYEYPENRDAEHPGFGYDGQFVYFIAADPPNARYYTDDPPYRYGRILYPMLARYAAAGDADAIPYSMLVINWLAAGVGTAALAAWLVRRHVSPWLALAFGLSPGVLLALERDLTEVLAYSLVAVAVYLFDYGGRRGVLAAAAVFALAGLTRETAILFPLLFTTSILIGRPNADTRANRRGRFRQAAGFVILSVAPVLMWAAVVRWWLGAPETGADDVFGLPFVGLFTGAWEVARQPVMLVFLALPALVLTAVAASQLRCPAGRLEASLVIVNALLVIVLASEVLWTAAYTSMARTSIPIMLAALLLLPYLGARGPRVRRAVGSAFALWLAFAPVVLVYGFTDFKV